MIAALPCLELIQYKAAVLFKKTGNITRPDFDLITFPQIWSSTCTGFDITPSGEQAWGGQVMTKEYTTIVHELTTDVYYVFFGHSPAYEVTDTNENFFEDLKNHNMASLKTAKERY